MCPRDTPSISYPRSFCNKKSGDKFEVEGQRNIWDNITDATTYVATQRNTAKHHLLQSHKEEGRRDGRGKNP
jgi:hypothetical protein